MTKFEKIKANKEQREKQAQKCKKCVWGMKQDGVIVCPFVECIK